MSRKILLLVIIAFLAGCGQPKQEPKFQGVEENKNYIQQGMKALQQKDVATAIKNFDKAIKTDPKNPDNYLTLGQVYLALKNYTRAIDTLTAATNVAPTNGQAYYLLAVSLKMRNKEGDLPKAVESAKRSIICFKQSQDKESFIRALGLLKNLTEGDQPAAEGAAQAATEVQETMQGLSME